MCIVKAFTESEHCSVRRRSDDVLSLIDSIVQGMAFRHAYSLLIPDCVGPSTKGRPQLRTCYMSSGNPWGEAS